MWLSRLDLLAYGRFTNVVLPLGPGFHLVYGPNEAGKSTTLRAIRQLLFGFDERTEDNFVHANTNLRIGGIIGDPTGAELHVIRRKGRKETLRAADDVTPIDADHWQKLLYGIDETTFSKRYGIDYEQLIEGGREIATGSGDLGEILFASGSGIGDLSAIQKRLDEEANELFKPKGKTQRLTQSIARWQKQRELVADRLLSINAWEEIDRQRQESRMRRDELAQQLAALSEQRDRYRRWNQAMPHVDEIKLLEQRAASLRSVRRLPADFEARRQSTLLQFKQWESQAAIARETLRAIQDERAKLAVSEHLIAKTDQLNRLFAEAGSYRKAQLDRKQLVIQLEQHTTHLENLNGKSTIAEKSSVILKDRGIRSRVSQLARQHAGLAQSRALAESRSLKLKRDTAEVRQRIAALPQAEELIELLKVVRECRSEGDLQTRRDGLNQELTALKSELQQQIDALTPWSGTILELKTLRLPEREDLRQIESDFEAVRSERTLLESRLNELKSEHGALSLKVKQLQLDFQIPTEAELLAARESRDATWAQIRDEFQSETVPSTAEIEAFDQYLHEADRLADRLRTEADRVAQLTEQLAEIGSNTAHQQELSTRLARLEETQSNINQRWVAAWSGLKAAPLSPREMQHWIAQRELVLHLHSQLSRRLAEFDELGVRINRQTELLSQALLTRDQPAVNSSTRQPQARRTQAEALSSSAQPVVQQQLSFGWSEQSTESAARAAMPNLTEQLAAAEKRLEIAESHRTARQHAEEALARLMSEDAETAEQLNRTRAELVVWQEEWHAAMQDLDLDPDSTPEQALEYVETQFQLMDHQIQAAQLQTRIAAIDEEAVQFRQDVDWVCQDIAFETAPQDAEERVNELRTRLTNCLRDQARSIELSSQENRSVRQIEQANESLQRSREELKALWELAEPGESLGETFQDRLDEIFDKLASAAEQSRQRAECDERLETTRQLLRDLASPETVDSFLSQVQRQTKDSIAGLLQELDRDIGRLTGEREAVLKQIAEHDATLKQMTGSDEAAEAKETLLQIQAEIRSDAEHYARLKLASSVLHSAIERYRDRIRGPVLAVAGELFRELTLGSFDGLRVDDDEQNQPILVGLRDGGKQAVSVHGMSEGTCDQLYLALRLASLKLESSPRNKLPFIVDDVLIQFDDARATAAMKILSRMGRTRQVIYFTHHRHLIEIAQEQLAENCALHCLQS